jgi:hypothetical protein
MPSDATRVFYVAGVTTGSRGRAKSAYHCLSFVQPEAPEGELEKHNTVDK